MKQHLAEGPLNPLVFHALNQVDGAPNTPAADQRREHQEMFLLLGDPALRLPRLAHKLKLDCPTTVSAGQTLTVQVELPAALRSSTVEATLERSFTSQAPNLENVPDDASDAERSRLLCANHKHANQFVLAHGTLTRNGNSVRAQLRVPDTLTWNKLIVRVVATGDVEDALGVRVVRVVTAKEPPGTATQPTKAKTQ